MNASADKLAEFKKELLKRPDYFMYWGDLDLYVWGITPIAQHRDSDILNQSNFEVVTGDLMERFPDSFVIERMNHWAVGWIEHLIINTDDEKAVEALYEWCESLEDYPVADESHYSNKELESYQDAWDNWAGYEIRRLVENYEIKGLLDEFGNYAATEEQESVIVGLLIDQFYYYGKEHFNEEQMIAELEKAFPWNEEHQCVFVPDTQTLTLPFEED